MDLVWLPIFCGVSLCNQIYLNFARQKNEVLLIVVQLENDEGSLEQPFTCSL